MNSLVAGWAIPIDPDEIGPRIESYVESKATIHTFQLCVAYSSRTALAKLPSEMVDMVGDYVREKVYHERRVEWVEAQGCLLADCQPAHHLSEAESDQLRLDFYKEGGIRPAENEEDDDSVDIDLEFEDYAEDEGTARARHDEIVKKYLDKIDLGSVAVNQESRFMRCRMVLAKPKATVQS